MVSVTSPSIDLTFPDISYPRTNYFHFFFFFGLFSSPKNYSSTTDVSVYWVTARIKPHHHAQDSCAIHEDIYECLPKLLSFKAPCLLRTSSLATSNSAGNISMTKCDTWVFIVRPGWTGWYARLNYMGMALQTGYDDRWIGQ